LKQAVSKVRNALANTDKTTSRWNREDKSKVTGLCNEKSEWLEKRRRDSTLQEVQQQNEDFTAKMEPYVAKLST